MPSLRLLPPLTLLLLLAPLAAGLAGTVLPAFGYLPALGGESFGLTPWRRLAAEPGLWPALWLSLGTGLAATVLSVTITLLFCAGWYATPWFGRLLRLLSPLLSLPHVALAFGLAFLIAPSGWLLRLLSPWATGLQRPPDWLIVNDPLGLTLIAGLVIKEIPFLLLMTLAALNQSDAARAQPLARTLGYGPTAAWLIAVLPRVYPQLRLPIFAVLAYSLSVVDMSIVLGPGAPPPLAVLLLRWFNDPDLQRRLVASAGALLQLALVLLALAGWWLAERALRRAGLSWLRRGRRWRHDRWLRLAAAAAIGLCFSAAALGMLTLILWSLAGVWRFPQALPGEFNLSAWGRGLGLSAAALWNTVSVGLASAGLALALSVGCLENEVRHRRRVDKALWLLYLPLLIPQLAFLFGAQVLLLVLRLDGSWLALVWSHLLFVLPYVYLSLADPYRRWDQRYARTALCLGATPVRVWYAIKLPLLLRPLLTAAAVGFAVSVSQYLPTLFAGAGRYPTLTTEAVALAAGGDRRLIGVFGLLLALLPLLAFAAAQLIPAWRYRHRRGLH